MKIDCRKIVTWFGGTADLSAALTAMGFDAKYKTVEKWRERHSLSAERVQQLQALAQKQGRVFDLDQFKPPA